MPETDPDLTGAFDQAMARFWPFEPRPVLAVAVSGGADSMALALLTRDWVVLRGGSMLALVVDHGLRPASASEARVTIERLAQLGIPARLLPLSNLRHGAALAERARLMRYQALTEICAEAGILHLLLGHHAADQSETLVMRVLRDSRTHGLASMSAVIETGNVRMLRPLLDIGPALLRCLLTDRGIGWVEDPSNQDVRATRARLRQQLAPETSAKAALLSAVARVGTVRSGEEVATAAELAGSVMIRPEGFALLPPGRIGSAALSRLVRTIGGGHYFRSPATISRLAAELGPAVVGGARITPAGRFGDGWLVVREEAAIMEPVEALPQVVWDNRFRLIGPAAFSSGAVIGKLGADAVRFRKHSNLPSTVLRTLPAVRFDKHLAAVPHLHYVRDEKYRPMRMLFAPGMPVAGAAFAPATWD